MTEIQAYSAPQSLVQALKLLMNNNTTVFAGGTDLMPQTTSGIKHINSHLMNIRRIPQLQGINRSNGTIRIGSLATVTEILKSDLLQKSVPILTETADCFASGQVRNSATLGGTISNASPAGDLIIPLILLDADVELASWKNNDISRRKIPIKDFFTGPGQTVMRSEELLAGFEFKIPHEKFRASFLKFGTRPAMDISIVSAGVAGVLSDRRLSQARVAFGAVAPIPLRGLKTEACIEGIELIDEVILNASSVAREEISPISDVRASAWYRKELIGIFIKRLLNHVIA